MLFRHISLYFVSPLLIRSRYQIHRSTPELIRGFSTSENWNNLQRIYINQTNLHPNLNIEIDDKKLHYMQNVLRFRRGERIRVFNGIDGEFLATYEGNPESKGKRLNKSSNQMTINECLRNQPRQMDSTSVVLMFALIKVGCLKQSNILKCKQ